MTTVMPSGAPGDAPAEPARRRAKGPTAAVRPDPKEQPGVPATPTSLTVKLTAVTMESLARAARVGETNLTDTVNRAVQLYDYVVTALAENKRNALVIVREGEADRIQLR
ncbi:MAG: hypothetical protein V7603_3744 [Micromonosporaceae bacterium]